MAWTDGFGNEGYEPDMTVQEALELGIVVVIDTIVIGRTYGEPCGYDAYTLQESQQGRRCTRAKGHTGNHAHVIRWEESYRDREERAKKEAYVAREFERAQRESLRQEREVLSARAATKEMMKTTQEEMDKILHKVASEKYSAMEGFKKNAKFRDKNAGKLRGR